MKTWQTYTLISFAGCLVALQVWETYALTQIRAGQPAEAVQEKKKKPSPLPQKTYTYSNYYWMALPKKHINALEGSLSAAEICKLGNLDIDEADDAARDLNIPQDSTYVGTLYQDDDYVYIVIKKTHTVKQQ